MLLSDIPKGYFQFYSDRGCGFLKVSKKIENLSSNLTQSRIRTLLLSDYPVIRTNSFCHDFLDSAKRLTLITKAFSLSHQLSLHLSWKLMISTLAVKQKLVFHVARLALSIKKCEREGCRRKSMLESTKKQKIKSFYVMKIFVLDMKAPSCLVLPELKYTFRVIYLIVFSCFWTNKTFFFSLLSLHVVVRPPFSNWNFAMKIYLVAFFATLLASPPTQRGEEPNCISHL